MPMKHASYDIRELAVKLYKSGNSTQQQVADIVCCYYKTIQNWIRADAEECEQPKPSSHFFASQMSDQIEITTFHD